MLLLLALCLVGGCASQQAAPGEVVSVKCDGMEWQICFQALTKRCGPAGYRLINQITDAGSSAGANNDSLVTGSLTRRSVVAQCKPVTGELNKGA